MGIYFINCFIQFTTNSFVGFQKISFLKEIKFISAKREIKDKQCDLKRNYND